MHPPTESSSLTPEWDGQLELTGEAFREMVAQAADRIAVFIDSLPEQPASDLDDVARRARAVSESLPQRGEPFEQLLDQLFRDVFPVALNTAGPGYLAYIPGGGLPHAAVADLVSLVVNRFVGLWSVAPVVAHIEATVIRWMCEIVGYGTQAAGFLTSGGSMATWAALVVARDSRMLEDLRSAVIYTSREAHHSVAKAARMAGFPPGQVSLVDVDDKYRIRVEMLRRLVAADRRQGRTPLAIVAQAGTTNTGAVDDLDSLAELASAEQLWMHVDAAYGGFFLLTERGRAAMRGISRADSITLDPHKGLFLPYGTGCLLARRVDDLHRTFAGRGEYMTAAASDEFVDFCDISPELTRDFRGLRIWLPIKMHGIGPFQQCLDEKLDLARYAADRLRSMDGIQVLADPPLSIVAFQLVRPGRNDDELNRLNNELLDRINASQRVRLSSTKLEGRLIIRLCILSFRTHRDRIDECLELIRAAASEI